MKIPTSQNIKLFSQEQTIPKNGDCSDISSLTGNLLSALKGVLTENHGNLIRVTRLNVQS